MRRHANAMREHSATALGPEVIDDVDVDEEDGERIRRFPTFGELVTLFKDRGWSGEWGRELDLRKALRTGVSMSPRDCGCFRTWCEGAAAALSVLSVTLITSVAKIAFSFADNSSSSWLSGFWDDANVFLVEGLVVLPGFV